MRSGWVAVAVAAAILAGVGAAQEKTAKKRREPLQMVVAPAVAATPPMGWNSWDSYGLTITEEQFRANVQILADKLKPFGWNYAVIDEGWFLQNPKDRPHPELLKYQIDGFGRYIPVPARFPSSVMGEPQGDSDPQNTGFKTLGDYVHGLGLKFGIHIVRGIPRVAVEANTPVEGSAFHAVDVADQTDKCPWDPTNWGVQDNAAGQAYYDSLLHQYAGWGVDLIKVDCIADNPYRVSEIRQIRKAIDKSGRPMVLSLSPGPTALEHAAEVGSLAQMWRISNDIWDYWTNAKPFPRSLTSQFETTAAWAKYARPGNWPDADMLPLGELRPAPGDGRARTSRLTPAEQRTMLTLWAMARSPLVLGANLTLMDANLEKLLTNAEVIRVDQTSTASRQAAKDGNLVAWTSDLADGSTALALFNLGDVPLEIKSEFAVYGLAAKSYAVKDAWTGADMGRMTTIGEQQIEPHASLLWELRK